MEKCATDSPQQVSNIQNPTPPRPPTSSPVLVSTLYVTNIHCQSCDSYAREVLSAVPEIVKVNISIADHSIRVEHQGTTDTAITIAKELTDAAFEVQHVETYDKDLLVHDFDPKSPPRRQRWTNTLFMSKAQRRHIENCNACKAKADGKNKNRKQVQSGGLLPRQVRREHGKTSVSKRDIINDGTESASEERPAVIDIESSETALFRAIISVGGMTCASCVNTITDELESMHVVHSVIVSLVANNASVEYEGPKENVDKIIEAIEDIGYEPKLGEVPVPIKSSQKPDTRSNKFRVSLSIEGMTCGSCVGTIMRGLEELAFVTSINIDLVGCSGVVDFEDNNNLEQILEKIEDLGYDATVVKLGSIDPVIEEYDTPSERTVTIAINGMFCEHCPDRVVKALLDEVGDAVHITHPPTLKEPRLTLAYKPAAPTVTARRFIAVINSAHEAFSATIDRPPSIEERSRAIQHREQRHIFLRLLFTFAVAIPTFIIGIVYMSLVPRTNATRKWFEQPVWAGVASRTEWAMFIMTTPVMFFGADVFHVRTYKELRALWRPGSKVPILRRFYRFGSMNMLISAGTSVAYFSSVAVLGLDASSNSTGVTSHSNDTYFDSVTFLTFFILIGKFLEAYSKAKTGDAVASLSSLRPSEALLVESTVKEDAEQDSTTRVPVDLLEVGDLVIVPLGTSPPTDGTVNQTGTFLFDESSLTGESKPVKKVLGEKVFAGSVNISQPVRVTVTDIGGTSMLDQIVAVVREGQTKRAPIERIADTITGYFVPIITLIAITVFVIWLGLGVSGSLPNSWLDVDQGGWTFWALEFAISVFVVACPCGIALAAPTALFVGGGLAAKHGILVQGGGEAFQEASKLDVIVFDKTGTLTEGQMKVTNCEIMTSEKEQQEHDLAIAFALAKVLEDSSNHPIARAIVEYCKEKQKQYEGTSPVLTAHIEEVPGQGMKGTFSLQSSSEDIVHYEAGIGNRQLLDTLGGSSADDSARESNFFLDQTLSKFQNLGQSTAVFFIRRLPARQSESVQAEQDSDLQQHESSDGNSVPTPVLAFAISDPLRPTTAAVLRTLQSEYKIAVHMCTGDNPTTARAIAAQLNIPASRVRAGVLPQDKAAYIKELQLPAASNGEAGSKTRRVVAFVGDGTNDAAALAAADVSVALSSGSDVAINSASFILLNSDLQTVLELVRLAKRVFWRVKANFVWAAVYNVALIPVAAGIFYPIGSHWRLGPVWSSAAMAASSVSVVTSSLALRLPEVRFPWGRGERT